MITDTNICSCTWDYSFTQFVDGLACAMIQIHSRCGIQTHAVNQYSSSRSSRILKWTQRAAEAFEERNVLPWMSPTYDLINNSRYNSYIDTHIHLHTSESQVNALQGGTVECHTPCQSHHFQHMTAEALFLTQLQTHK